MSSRPLMTLGHLCPFPDQLPPDPPASPPQPAAPASTPPTPGKCLQPHTQGRGRARPHTPSTEALNLAPDPTPEVPLAPRTLLEALEQRMERYRVAAAQAKAKGDQRKARMHERIVKVWGRGHSGWVVPTPRPALGGPHTCDLPQQYQDALRAHKAGKAVDVAELPVPPGRLCPPQQAPPKESPTQNTLSLQGPTHPAGPTRRKHQGDDIL